MGSNKNQLPSLPEQERQVLAACVSNGLSWWEMVESIGGEDTIGLFWEADHRIVAKAMAALTTKRSIIDVASLTDYLSRTEEGSSLLTPDIRTYLQGLTISSRTRSTADLQKVTTELLNSRTNRDLIGQLEETLDKAREGESHPNEIVGDLRTISSTNAGSTSLRSLGDLISQMEEEDSLGISFRVKTGVQALDNAIKGYEPGRMYIVGARPKVGKTTFGPISGVLEALADDCVVLLASLEIPRKELYSKLLSAQSYVEQRDIQEWLDAERKFSDFTDEQQELITEARSELKGAALYILESVDVPNGVDSIIAAAMSLRSKFKPETKMIVFVDYLQLMTPSGVDPRVACTEATRKIKLSAMALNIPYVVLSQINRGGAEDGMPAPHNLRDSGSIEQDADCVIMLNRPYLQDESVPKHIMDISVPLCRYASSAWVKAFYAPEFQTIRDLDIEGEARSESRRERQKDEIEPDDREERRKSRREEKVTDKDKEENRGRRESRRQRERVGAKRDHGEEDYI